LRPCDANETAEARRIAFAQANGPTCLILSRHPLPTLDRTRYAAASRVVRGAYILAESSEPSEIVLIGTGSEISLRIGVYQRLQAEGVKARIVPMPSWDLIELQKTSYSEHMLPPQTSARVAANDGAAWAWERYVGGAGEVLAMRSFGASAPVAVLASAFGFTTDDVYRAAQRQLADRIPTGGSP
jgi:transketolase